MTRTPMHPAMLSEDQKVDAIVHQNEFIRELLVRDLELMVLLGPERLPADIAKAVAKHMEERQAAIAASNAAIDKIFSRTPHRVSEPLQ